MDTAGDDVVEVFVVFIDLGVSFRFADFLNNHLLCGLRPDPPDYFFVIKFFLTTSTGDLPRIPFDDEFDICFFAEMFSRSGDQCRFDCGEDNFFFNVFFLDEVNQQFAKLRSGSFPFFH